MVRVHVQAPKARNHWLYSLFEKHISTLTSFTTADKPGHRNVRKECQWSNQQVEGTWMLVICDDVQQRRRANTLEYGLKCCLNYLYLQLGYATGLLKSAKRKSITNGS